MRIYKVQDLSGLRFGALTVLSRAPNKGPRIQWHTRCDCGKEKVIDGAGMKSGAIVTCGKCRDFADKKNEYSIWSGMKRRCTNPKEPAYKRYGGRGIYVCDRWLESFYNFYADMGPKPEGKELDRIDNDGPYSPENCRWATYKENSNNRRNNTYITHNGKTQTLQQWADETGIGRRTIYARVRHCRWPIERALTEPVHR